MNTLTQRVAAGVSVLAVLFLLASLPQESNAAVIRVGDVYTHGTEATTDGDMYLLGETVSVHGSSTGDLFMLAGGVDIAGSVGGDVLGLGGNIYVSAPVSGDLRTIGGDVRVTSNIAEDALLIGGTVVIEKEAHIKGDLIVYADYVEILGTVEGSTDIFAGNALVRGALKGHASVEVVESLAIEKGASFGAGLTYRAPNEIVIPTDVSVTGEVVYEPRGVDGKKEHEAAWPGLMFRIVMSLLAGVLILKLFPTFAREASTRVLANNGTVALVGLAVLVSVPVLAVLLIATFLGIIPALFILFIYGASIVFACALAPILAGAALASWLKKEDGMQWHWVSLGAIALTLLTLVPVVGWIVRLIVFLTALGTIMLLAYERIWKHRKDSPTEPVALEGAQAEDVVHQEEHHEETTEDQTKEEQSEESTK